MVIPDTSCEKGAKGDDNDEEDDEDDDLTLLSFFDRGRLMSRLLGMVHSLLLLERVEERGTTNRKDFLVDPLHMDIAVWDCGSDGKEEVAVAQVMVARTVAPCC